jgi:hypothetical protein
VHSDIERGSRLSTLFEIEMASHKTQSYTLDVNQAHKADEERRKLEQKALGEELTIIFTLPDQKTLEAKVCDTQHVFDGMCHRDELALF